MHSSDELVYWILLVLFSIVFLGFAVILAAEVGEYTAVYSFVLVLFSLEALAFASYVAGDTHKYKGAVQNTRHCPHCKKELVIKCSFPSGRIEVGKEWWVLGED
jgi:hypothetical protein